MISKEELSSLYADVLDRLITQTEDSLRFYVRQEAFSHMTLSVAFWHSDLYWNIWNKNHLKFNEHPRDYHDEFIVESASNNQDEASIKLMEIYSDWGEMASNEEDDYIEGEDVYSRCIKLTHEALATAINSEFIKQKFISILQENPNFEQGCLEDVVHVEDPDGQFEFNFMNPVAQSTE
ncbi:hypothetical protein [Shewanella sp. MBTL60-007]|uniref:hypothetical protein n=1 Tax=Shewanella sp. MBTL60-007 TaxID=2815911 RepID=UPI001BBA7508|nr:hypothetical protein [Shewanella sp. MBTL60-007]GIU32294.1 hypothetical protein TUM3792_44700 [Shewanella sp. MBTL60-007]